MTWRGILWRKIVEQYENRIVIAEKKSKAQIS